MQPFFQFFSLASSTTSTAITPDDEEDKLQPLTSREPVEKRKRRSVSFFGRVVVYDHIGRDELTEDEHYNCWYTRQDLHQIHKECDETVRRMMAGACSGARWCARGLESRTRTGAHLRFKNRRVALDKVMEYQSLEFESGIDRNDEKIAKIYSEYTEHCTRISHLMATIDAQSVEADNGATKSTLNSTSTSSSPRCLPHITSGQNAPSPIVLRAA